MDCGLPAPTLRRIAADLMRTCLSGAAAAIAMAVLAGSALAQTAVVPPPPAPPAPPLPPEGITIPAAPAPLALRAPAPPSSARAVLQGLDKVTARISTFEVPINQLARFGTLEITVRACHKTPPEEPPESTAFVEIADARGDQLPLSLFRGWMFASSPALSALEHPVYDVWVVDCINASNAPSLSSR